MEVFFQVKKKISLEQQIGGKQETKGIIEAASVVTASLKSKLSMAEKELEASSTTFGKRTPRTFTHKRKTRKIKNV